jgi:hypothetical protein
MSTEPAAYCYRLYIGESTVSAVVECLKNSGFNATVHEARGLWQGTAEPCIVAEIIHERILDGSLRVFARTLAREFGQDCVLLTRFDLSRVAYIGQHS